MEAVMHPFPHTINLRASLAVALEMLKEHNVRHLPVKEGNTLMGILTDRDINFALRVDHKEANELTVRDAYTSDPFVVQPNEAVSTVAARMAHDHLGCALVAEHGNLLGIFTTVDACRTLAELLKGSPEQ